MAEEKVTSASASDSDLDDLVASSDTGARSPSGLTLRILLGTALLWSLFQVWIASPLPFLFADITGIQIVLNSTEERSIHLAFAILLAFLAYPALKRSPREYVPIVDWVAAIVGALAASYLFLFYEEISTRIGRPITQDIVVACIGVVLLLEATRRSLGPPLMIVASVFLFYTFAGPYMPDIISHKGNSLAQVVNHQWITTEGVFGIALGVSTKFVFLFVLFGALLERAGAGNYFIQVAFSLLGHLRGGPAKAAVVSSGMTGLISGSSIANVVTTGTFTIPLMKRVGFSAEKAGAVEVASSVNGQIMPPVMGAAAFLMVEFVGITYLEVIKHAFLPALISYIALVYIVHLEAVKADLKALPKPGERPPAKLALLGLLITVASLFVIAGVVFWILDLVVSLATPLNNLIAVLVAVGLILAFLRVLRNVAQARGLPWLISVGGIVLGGVFLGAWLVFNGVELIRELVGPNFAPWIYALFLGAIYVALIRFESRYDDLELDDPNAPVVKLPEVGPTVKTGIHFILPVIVLVWCLMVERLSPGLSAFWATALMIFILLTQRPLLAFFRNQGEIAARIRQGWDELIEGLIAGARNMIGIGIATATAGIIVGAVSQTGVGSVLADVVETLSFGSILMILFLTAILSLILGMGLPTTANYIVVSALLAPVIVDLGQSTGLIVPLIAVHLFVFYFGIMADVTPPVGLASFAAAAVSGGDPIRTGFVAFFYSLRTAALPFLFIFNTDLLLINVTPLHAVIVFIVATAAMLVFAAASQGFFFARNRVYETVLLLLIAFSLFRPGFWMDLIVPPYEEHAPAELAEVFGELEPGTEVRMQVLGVDEIGVPKDFTFLLDVGEGATGEERLAATGLAVIEQDGKIIVDDAAFDSPAQEAGFDWDQEIQSILAPTEQPPKELIYIPVFVVLGLIIVLQRRRNAVKERRSEPATA